MKKLGICLILFFSFLGTSCFAQSNNDAQRIVGTWVEANGSSFTFNSNGTFSSISTINSDYNENGNYFISGSKIIFKIRTDVSIYDFYISQNGRILAINWSDSREDVFWYEKK